jgi:hypothetical protein
MKLQIEGRGFIDDVSLMLEPTRRGQQMRVVREYERVREGMDLAAGEPWVQWRRALQGGGEL